MKSIYKKRFFELQEQMDALLASQKNTTTVLSPNPTLNIDPNLLLEWTVKTKSLLTKACGAESEHYKAFVDNDSLRGYSTHLETLKRLRAIFLAAKEDYEGGYLKTTRSLIQAEVFDSELEQAKELCQKGYKSPSAVVAGVVLETSLRELCDQAGLSHGKLDKMNSELTKLGKYNSLQQKRITALADIRNSAAHGKSEEFTEKDVLDMIRDIERFLAEHL
ncbi:MAG: DUF4145 domain-containing protein [Chlorobiaceae bacterium]|nr:DUF4145 domain-containing protein [Chlorobiaceae bacterium]